MPVNGRVRLELDLRDGGKRVVTVDHVIAGTGYRVDMRRLPFFGPELLDRLDCVTTRRGCHAGSRPRSRAAFPRHGGGQQLRADDAVRLWRRIRLASAVEASRAVGGAGTCAE